MSDEPLIIKKRRRNGICRFTLFFGFILSFIEHFFFILYGLRGIAAKNC